MKFVNNTHFIFNGFTENGVIASIRHSLNKNTGIVSNLAYINKMNERTEFRENRTKGNA